MKYARVVAFSGAAGLLLAGCSSQAAANHGVTSTNPHLAAAVAAQPVLASARADDFAVAAADGPNYYFASPNGQFTCGIVKTPTGAARAECAGAIPPNAPRSLIAGEFDSGELVLPTVIAVSKGVAAEFGHGDPAAFHGTARPARPLPYGHPLSARGLTCTVFQDTGVTCDDGGSHGFTVSDRDYLAH